MTAATYQADPLPQTGFTWRAMAIGIGLVLVIGCCGPYGSMYIQGSFLFLDFSTAGATFLLFALILIANLGLARLVPAARLSRAELALVAVMMIVASSIPTMGLTAYLLPNITAPYYYGIPGVNQWQELILPHIQPWLVPVDWSAPTRDEKYEAIRLFYEGLTQAGGVWDVARRVPWAVWLRPLALWFVFLAGLYTVMVTTMVIVRRQWIEYERLIFPIAHVPIELIRGSAARPRGPGAADRPIWLNAAMWGGFALPFLLGTLRALGHYFPEFPGALRPGGMATAIKFLDVDIPLRVSFPMVGFAFLINREIAFSLWLYCLVGMILAAVFPRLGIELKEDLAIYGATGQPIFAHMGMGAMIVLVASGLWVARRHLAAVARRALGRDPTVRDDDEILSYRAAVGLWLAGLAIMVGWVWASGLSLGYAVLLVGSALLIFYGLTRVVCEAGMAVSIAPLIAPTFLTSGFGSASIGPAGMTALAFSWVWMGDIRTFVMASTAHGLRVLQEAPSGPRHRRRVALGIALAIALSLIGSTVVLILVAYAYGGVNLQGWFFRAGPQFPYNYLESHLREPLPPNWGGWAWTAVGAVVMLGLMTGRRLLSWWPLHPVGFPIAAVDWTRALWLSVFIAWAVKSTIIKYGGPRLYRQARPFFLGLILGQFSVSGVWYFIDFATGRTGNVLFWI